VSVEKLRENEYATFSNFEIFTVNISSWKIHKLILSDSGKISTDFEKKKKKTEKNNFYKIKKLKN